MDKGRLLHLMRNWLLGVLVTVFAVTTIYLGLFIGRDWNTALRSGILMWAVTGALCIVWYNIYKVYLDRRV